MDNNSYYENEELDPVVKLLQKSLEYMTGRTEHRINNVEEEIIRDLLARSMPDYLSLPIPFMAMIQLQKKDVLKQETDPVISTRDSCFSFSAQTKDNIRKDYEFIPLINANIIKGHVVEVGEGLLANTWDVDLEVEEPVDNISGMAFFFRHKSAPYEQIELSCGGRILPVTMMSDYNHLPFSETIVRYMQYNGNEQVYKLLMHWHDILCSRGYSYCIVQPYNNTEVPLHPVNGTIRIALRFQGGEKVGNIQKDDILLNCIPVINANEDIKLVSETTILDLEHGKYLIAEDTSENPSFKKRRFGIAHEGTKSNRDIFIALHKYNTENNKEKYHVIHYLASDDDVPITKNCELMSRSSEFSSAIVVETFPCEKQTSETLQLKSLYHLQTHDRIVTPSDILSFCKTQLVTLMGYEESQIKSMEWNRTECKAEIMIEGKKEIDEDDIKSQTAALKAMITKRTSMLTPVDIHITYSCTKR